MSNSSGRTALSKQRGLLPRYCPVEGEWLLEGPLVCSKSTWQPGIVQAALSPGFLDRVSSRQVLGCIAPREEAGRIPLTQVSHLVLRVGYEAGRLLGMLRVLNTPRGRDLLALITENGVARKDVKVMSSYVAVWTAEPLRSPLVLRTFDVHVEPIA